MGIPPKETTLGFIPASRGSFSAELAAKVRGETLEALKKPGVRVVVPSAQQTRAGCVQSLQEAETCAELFRQQKVQGILVGAGNFGEEQAVAWTIHKAGLNVPVMIFGCQEEETLTRKTVRRDSFCGLLSIGDVLRQIGVKYSVGQRPICFPSDASFAADLDWFIRVCRVIDGVRNARYAQIGARPDAFWTCRYSEKQLQRLGPTAVVLDLSEAIGAAQAMADDDPEVQKLVAATGRYADTSAVTPEGVLRSAKTGVVPAALQGATEHRRFLGPVLDLVAVELRGVQLRGHEPAGRRRHAGGLRVGHPGHAVDARRVAGQRVAGRPCRLEQFAQRGRRTGQHLALRRIPRLVCQDQAEARPRTRSSSLAAGRPTNGHRAWSSSSPSRRR